MKITNIRSETKSLEFIQAKLSYLLAKAGFNVNVNIVNKSRIDITGPYRMKGPQRLTHTYTVNILCFKKGYRRSYKPTWDQYVELNNLVNSFLDKHNITASVKSLDYIVRSKTTGAEYQWSQPYWVLDNEAKGYGPTFETEKQAIEYVANFKRACTA